MTHTLVLKNQHFVLHPSGAAFWEEQHMLLVADVHFGKITHFRKYGSAVPLEVAHKNFEKLNKLIADFNPGRICFLGDLFHSYINSEWDMFARWTQEISSKIILITGNHDIISPLRYQKINVQLYDEWIIDHFLLTHHPEEKPKLFNFCGHIHPAIRLQGKGRQSLKLACFFEGERQLIFPAFGVFTGTHLMEIGKKNKAYVITENEVFPV
ncbi:ligase-associated DNA damage response endonuclease PdeM [Spongiimicrobium salis]|uniref:ligase-associated DNA damage response endonuclease PdeM n=1 Tax=Spongiimicrobium salis TaxID=1667022 RepID=UPI00374D31AA